MSHHLDTPLAAQTGQLYIDDLYVFPGEGSTVFVMDVNSNVNGLHSEPGFHPEARYEFKVHFDGADFETLTYRVSFSEPDSDGRQALQLHALAGDQARQDSAVGDLVLQGRTGEAASGGGTRLWAGRIADSFYIDLSLLAIINGAVANGTAPDLSGWRPDNAQNSFADTTVDSIVLEVSHQHPQLRLGARTGVWCATKLATDAGGWRQINRAGHPMMWPIFWPDDTDFSNPANTRHPSEDVNAAAKYIGEQAGRAGGEQPDDLPGPAADGGGRDAVAAGQVSQPVVMAQRGQHDQRDLAGRQLAPPGPGLLQVGAQQISGEGERLARQRQRALIDKRGALGGLDGCVHTRLCARRGHATRQAGPLRPAGSGRDGELPGGGAAQPAAVFEPLELGADVLAVAAGHVQAGALGGPPAGHRPAGFRCDCGDRLHQRPVVIWEAARVGCLAARGYQQPETPLPGRPGASRLLAGGRHVIGRQLADDLTGDLQPFQFVPGVGELLAQQLYLAGQLAHPAGDSFRQLHPGLQGYYRPNRDGHRR
jgi:hypothetical protein